MACQFMRGNKKRYTIQKMTGLFGVSRSAYYKWARNGVSRRRSGADAELLCSIRETAARHRRRYGRARVRQELLSGYGKQVGLKKVARLMRGNGLNAQSKRNFIPATNSKHTLAVCKNILNRDFHAEKGGIKRVSDITCLRTCTGWACLTVVLDLYDRGVLGWSLGATMETPHTAIPAFQMAVKNRSPANGLIFHSDRGVQYCALSFREVLRNYCPSVNQSMSRKGNCWDNACAESFFKTLKRELETLDGRHTEAEVRQSVFYYIEAYYNRIRIHSALDNLAPNVFYLLNSA